MSAHRLARAAFVTGTSLLSGLAVAIGLSGLEAHSGAEQNARSAWSAPVDMPPLAPAVLRDDDRAYFQHIRGIEPQVSAEPLTSQLTAPPAEFDDDGAILIDGAFAVATLDADLVAALAPPASIADPHWLQRPSAAEIARHYPAKAAAVGASGEASLDCLVETDGALSCTVANESPRGWGFGEAALAISTHYRMQPPTKNGAVVRGRYTLEVPFDLR